MHEGLNVVERNIWVLIAIQSWDDWWSTFLSEVEAHTHLCDLNSQCNCFNRPFSASKCTVRCLCICMQQPNV